ncbi:MAG TPA: hypothetical protein VMB84_15555, partial [Stellaceae bacterium]|nr:hypothetical protein [Stellaceae bacterium]
VSDAKLVTAHKGTTDYDGHDDLIAVTSGSQRLNILGDNDTVRAGYRAGTSDTRVDFSGGSADYLTAGPGNFADTVVGFDQSGGDRIRLTTERVATALAHSKLVDGGEDSRITLSDGSTILLKGITQLDSSFFA